MCVNNFNFCGVRDQPIFSGPNDSHACHKDSGLVKKRCAGESYQWDGHLAISLYLTALYQTTIRQLAHGTFSLFQVRLGQLLSISFLICSHKQEANDVIFHPRSFFASPTHHWDISIEPEDKNCLIFSWLFSVIIWTIFPWYHIACPLFLISYILGIVFLVILSYSLNYLLIAPLII